MNKLLFFVWLKILFYFTFFPLFEIGFLCIALAILYVDQAGLECILLFNDILF